MTLTGRKATIAVGVLIASVCLNVLVAAAWATHRMWGDPGRGIERLVATAPEETRETLRARFEAVRPEIHQHFREVRTARAAIASLIRNPQTDETELRAAYADLRRRADEIQILVHDTLVEALLEMPDDARRQWAAEWEKRQ